MASSYLIVQRYAQALLDLAREQGTSEQVEAELGALDGMLAENADLRRQLGNPRLGRDVTKRILADLIGDAPNDLLRRTLMLMADKGRAGLLPEFASAYNEVAMIAAGRQIAKVASAAPLDDQMRGGLKARLEALTGKEIIISESVDESLLGGLRVTIGSRMIDGSLKRRLAVLETNMLNAPLAPGS